MGAPRIVGEVWAYRPSGALVAGAAALVLAAAGGWWLGGSSREEVAAPAPDTVITVGAPEARARVDLGRRRLGARAAGRGR